ncbi:MarR family winged helix-turn-helix transcriptional regulator [Cellulomonas triticagri]|uniref:MarR family transcriptional regulator n=1 Tax=Cellulomonas triticagri TaxID=2483352 RepID=A0A3M2JRH2_9CELL|nr:MarR family winged helix-turn-helix transcriptional regulator [Cellulomonas triticagri]RMI12828.1 MarR family transcriptional regulator [Cellulomonas triticagri]
MPSTPPYRALVDAIARLQRVQRDVASEMARELDCPRAALSTLWLLDKRGEMGIGDLAQHLHVDISVASRQVTQLVEAGHAERTTPDAPGTDRRVRTVRLTEQGRRFTASTKVALDERAATVFGAWTPDDLLDAASAIEKVADAVQGLPLDARPLATAT